MKYVEIMIKGKINTDWSDWFEGLEISNLNGDSLLQGRVSDMAAVYGIIERIKTLGVEIIPLNCTDL